MTAESWLEIPGDSHFSLNNIPFGIISTASAPSPHPAIAIGTHVLDLAVFTHGNGFSSLPTIQPHLSVFNHPTLNAFASLGRPIHRSVRTYLQDVLSSTTSFPGLLKDNTSLRAIALLSQDEVTMHLPMLIGDYTDFFAGRNHASNVGAMFRGAANALQPNYHHLPVAYHGRSSSVVVSGTPIRRPLGQTLPSPTATTPVFGPCKRLDMELELGCFLCRGNQLGSPIPLKGGQAEESIFGFVLLNDWSARDVQTWEYVPLGPFNAKNFGTTVSAWVVLADALEPYRVSGLGNEMELLPYLKEGREDGVYDIQLEVDLTSMSFLSPLSIRPQQMAGNE